MWSDWLADTLSRSTFEAETRVDRVQRILLSDDRAEPARPRTDWDGITDLLIHEGFGAEWPDA